MKQKKEEKIANECISSKWRKLRFLFNASYIINTIVYRKKSAFLFAMVFRCKGKLAKFMQRKIGDKLHAIKQ